MEKRPLNNFKSIRKVSALLLLISFFLPLSKCTFEPGDAAFQTKNRVTYPYIELKNYCREFKQGSMMDMAIIVAFLILFFLPLSVLTLPQVVQSSIHVLGAAPALSLLFFYFVSGDAMIGAWMALGAWLSLIVAAILDLSQHFFGKIKQTS